MSVKQIAPEALVWATDEPRPVRPQPRRFGALLATMALLAVTLGTSAVAPTPADGYTWGPWHTKWYAATATECRKAKQLADRFYGPVQLYGNGCYRRVRARMAAINTTTWTDAKVQIENAAPVWPAWGYRLTVNVSWNGSTAKYDPASFYCEPWSFIVKVSPTECAIFGNRTSKMLLRARYDANFLMEGGFFSIPRGVSMNVRGTTGPDWSTLTQWAG